MATISANASRSAPDLIGDFPIASYVETTFRTNAESTSPADGGAPNGVASFFQWSTCGELAGVGGVNCTNGAIEIDTIEAWSNYAGSNGPDGGVHNWCGATDCITNRHDVGQFFWAGYKFLPSGFTFSQYHKFGSLTTSDGTHIVTCEYIDDKLIASAAGPSDPAYPCTSTPGVYAPAPGPYSYGGGSPAERQDLAFWVGNISWYGHNGCPGSHGQYTQWCLKMPDGAIYAWIKSVKVYTCADWQRDSTGLNPHCFGGPTLRTGSRGEQLYQR
jgi:hypothetical protein